MNLTIKQIRTDGGTQPRAEINGDTVNEYRQDMLSGSQFPPVTVFYDGSDYWLADGFHRLIAAQSMGWDEIAADVRQGTRRDAVLYSVGANAAHGMRRTNEDKRRAVETLLNDPEWTKWSDREIARRCRVGKTTVLNYRKSLSGQLDQIEDRKVERNGTTYTMNTAPIGRKPEPEPVTVAAISSPGFAFVSEPDDDIIPVFGEDDMPEPEPYNRVIVGDCLDEMARLPNGMAQLIITSPPYPGQRGNDMSVLEWLKWMEPRMEEMARLLHPYTGVLAFNVMFKRLQGWFDNRLLINVPLMIERAGMALIDVYIWTKPNPVPAGNLDRCDIPAWEPIFIAAHSADYIFNPVYDHYSPKTLGKLLPGNRARGEGAYTNGHSRISGEGARQSNVLALSPSGEGERPRATGQSFPLGLPDRFIRQYSNEGDLIIDPFCGAGTTLKVAQANGREWLGIEMDGATAKLAMEWLDEQ